MIMKLSLFLYRKSFNQTVVPEFTYISVSEKCSKLCPHWMAYKVKSICSLSHFVP